MDSKNTLEKPGGAQYPTIAWSMDRQDIKKLAPNTYGLDVAPGDGRVKYYKVVLNPRWAVSGMYFRAGYYGVCQLFLQFMNMTTGEIAGHEGTTANNDSAIMYAKDDNTDIERTNFWFGFGPNPTDPYSSSYA